MLWRFALIVEWGFDCVQNALYTRDNKPICLNCSKKEASAQANYASSEVYALKRRLIICIVIFIAGIVAFNTQNEAPLNFFTMIGVWCFANIGSVLFAIFRPVDSVNEALTRHKDGEGWFIGRLMLGLIVAIFWGIFLPIQILRVVYKLSQAKKQASVF